MSSLSVGVEISRISFVSVLLLFVFFKNKKIKKKIGKFKNPKILSCFPYCFELDFLLVSRPNDIIGSNSNHDHQELS